MWLYIVCVFLKNYLCVCVFVCAPTGLKGGALCRHAPCAGAAASGPHDRELVQCIGLQTCHHVVQAGSVRHLRRERQTYSLISFFPHIPFLIFTHWFLLPYVYLLIFFFFFNKSIDTRSHLQMFCFLWLTLEKPYQAHYQMRNKCRWNDGHLSLKNYSWHHLSFFSKINS